MSVIAIFRQQFTVSLRKELNDSRFEVVHRACNLYTAGGFEIPTPRSIRNRHLYRRALAALVAVDILGRDRVVVGTAIRYRRVTVERRGS